MPRDNRSSPQNLHSQIKQQAFANFQKVNEQRYAVTLPTEILSIIFEYACIDSATSLSFPVTMGDSEFLSGQRNKGGYRYVTYVPLTLGAVCARWRQVAWSTPSLWTSISLRLVLESYSIRVATSILLLYLQNSGPFPISLGLDFQSSLGTPSTRSGQATLRHFREKVVRPNSSKFRAIRVTSPPKAQWLLNSGVKFSALEDLSIHSSESFCSRQGSQIHLQNLTALRRLYIYSVLDLEIGAKAKPLPNITVLHLYHVPKDVCISLLILCPNLISYQCHHISRVRSKVSEPRKLVTLPYLKDFGWDCKSHPPEIEAFRFPSLTNLFLHVPTADMEFMRTGPFPNISSTLRVLELHEVEVISPSPWGYEKIKDFFKESLEIFVNVTKLTLSGSGISILSCLLTSLTPSRGCEGVLLPNLSILQCRDLRGDLDSWDKKCEGDSSLKLAKMLKMRSQCLNGPLQFEVIGGCGIVWRIDAQKEIAAMVAQGLELQIIEDARPVDWLGV